MTVFGFLIAAVYCVIGIAIAVLSLPWRNTEWRNVSTLEYWTVHAIFWPYLLLTYAWLAFRRFLDAWGDYRARRRYLRGDK
jgi:hypothetical protein